MIIIGKKDPSSIVLLKEAFHLSIKALEEGSQCEINDKVKGAKKQEEEEIEAHHPCRN